MFQIKCFNLNTGHVETVSAPLIDSELGSIYRAIEAERYASADHSDSHVYYADDLDDIPMVPEAPC